MALFEQNKSFWPIVQCSHGGACAGRRRYICCHCLCVLSMDGYISQGWDTSDILVRIRNELSWYEKKDKVRKETFKAFVCLKKYAMGHSLITQG